MNAPDSLAVIAGAYRATWNALNVGNTDAGFKPSYTHNGRPIRFDSVGSGQVDGIFTGVMMNIDMVLMQWFAPANNSMRWPFYSIHGTVPAAGVSMFAKAKPFVLTSCVQGVEPKTRTYYKTIMAVDFTVEELMAGQRERVLPMRLMVFPVKYNSSGYTTPEMPDGCAENVYYEETYWP